MAGRILVHIQLFCRLVFWQSSHRRVVQEEGVEDMCLHTDNHNDPSARHLCMMEDKLAQMTSHNRPQIDYIRLLRSQPQVL